MIAGLRRRGCHDGAVFTALLAESAGARELAERVEPRLRELLV